MLNNGLIRVKGKTALVHNGLLMTMHIIGNIRSISCCTVLAISLLLASCSTEDQVKPLKPLHIATGDWEPYIGQNLPNDGPLAEMLSTILAEMHYVAEYQYYSWTMAENNLEEGYPSMAFPFIKSKERADRGLHFSDPLVEFDYVLFYHKKRHQQALAIKTLDEITNSRGRIGRVLGYAKIPDTADDVYTTVESTIEGFNRLRDDDDIHFLLESKQVGTRLLESENLADDKGDFYYLGQFEDADRHASSRFVRKVGLRIMLSSKLDPGILTIMNEKIEKHKNSNYFQRLKRRMNAGNDVRETGYLISSDSERIFGYLDRFDLATTVMIPRNSRVLIAEWGGGYVANELSAGKEEAPDRSRVKLLNGPFRGKVMWVENRHLSLER